MSMLLLGVEQEGGSGPECLAKQDVVGSPADRLIRFVHEDLGAGVIAAQAQQGQRGSDLGDWRPRPEVQRGLEVDQDPVVLGSEAARRPERLPPVEGDAQISVAIGGREHGDLIAVFPEAFDERERIRADAASPGWVRAHDQDAAHSRSVRTFTGIASPPLTLRTTSKGYRRLCQS
jgi:hypothetical protein